MTDPCFRGLYTALVTPFRDGALDETAFVDLVERQIAAGVQGLAPITHAGEAAALSPAERQQVVSLCVRTARGRLPVIAGVGATATHKAVEWARMVKAAGADAALVVTPAYVRPSQEGLYQHYRAIAEAVDLPLLAYVAPARTRVDLEPETLGRLARLANVVGVADEPGDLTRLGRMRRSCGEGWSMLTGDDGAAVGHIAEGGHGVISVTANVAPEACVRQVTAALAGDLAQARHWQDRLAGLHASLSLDASPAPAKFALARMGLCAEETRLPITPCAAWARPSIQAALDGVA